MNGHQALAIKALEEAKGDATARAKRAFAGMSREQMQEPYGSSGKTYQQILDGCVAQDHKYDEAIEWVKRSKLA